MSKEGINFELTSNIEIQVQETLFYLPGEIIIGNIFINPKSQINHKENLLHLSLKIMQYQFWNYSNIDIKELKNIYSTKIQEEELVYELKEEEIIKQKYFENLSMSENQEENKMVSIPFKIKVEENKILPTFQYEDNKYILGIRHLLIVECKEYNSYNCIGLFIGKDKNKELCSPKEIKEKYIFESGPLEIKADYPKLSFSFDEEIKAEFHVNSNLYFKKIKEIEQIFYRKIVWISSLKNTNLNKHIYNTQKFQYNPNKYGLLTRLSAPIIPAITTVGGGLAGGATGVFIGMDENIQDPDFGTLYGIIGLSTGMILGLFTGICQSAKITKDILNLNDNDNRICNNLNAKIEKTEDKKSLVENLKKFVYFKNNKIVGFIKFKGNITPPVNGYFFNCNYFIKIKVQTAGVILNRNKYLKTQIDLYDSDECIANLKKIFKS